VPPVASKMRPDGRPETRRLHRVPGRSCQLSNSGQEPVRHAFPYIRARIHPSRNGPLYITERVIQQHFIVAHKYTDWR
jgi:hypothetical protein